MSSSDKYKNHPWDKARSFKLKRRYVIQNNEEVELDPGVNYFILQLEKLGATTIASCEGHEKDLYLYGSNCFYIWFKCSLSIASKLVMDSNLPEALYRITLETVPKTYSMRFVYPWETDLVDNDPFTNVPGNIIDVDYVEQKERALRSVVDMWELQLGSLF